ncbi:conserved hypothetical protein [Vibrio nigripulchritudo SOn1]|uniref:Uncharacterized protein n=1 Tax=Vibrio nigripulchritudo SOn1 TaxID=1238450 RepID=A0AAV2VNV0_9VIBR|nr:hypothetical protein [Vibrio nigripulchritudo]CCO46334.1 conserved hypothetical protein [Vibrio nigripulchritudo SOn1]
MQSRQVKTKTNDSSLQPDSDLQLLVSDGCLLLHYVARHGDLSIDANIAQGIAQANAKLGTKYWNTEDEIQLLHSFDRLAKQVYPVTVESIKAVVPSASDGKVTFTGATRVITWYRRYTVMTLICLLAIQMFYLFGHSLTQTLADSLPQATFPLSQDLEANYQLLKKWNWIWMLGQEFQFDLPVPNEAPNQLELEYQANLIAAQSVLQMLQNYVLPLLYGLLGAFIFVLRSLLQQVRNLTYTASREVGYRLRLTLGCLAGMITGWLLKPEMGDMTLSPMALAFLAGYSIEVMFTLLDRLIDGIRKNTEVASPSTGGRKS